MANRLYIYSAQKLQTKKVHEMVVEANYELPLYFYPLFVSNVQIKNSSIFASTAQGIAFFEQFYNFIQTHADALIADLSTWQEKRQKMSAELAHVAEQPWLMLEMSDVFQMSDTSPKQQAQEQLELLHQINGIIQDAIDANNPDLLDQLVSIRSIYASFSSFISFKEYFNYESYEYGWQYFEAQYRTDSTHESSLPTEFEQDGKFGLKNIQGEIITPPDYDSLYAFDEITKLIVAEKAGKFCFLNSSGKVEFNQYFDDLYDFFEGDIPAKQVAIASADGQFGLINRKGQWVVPPSWDDMRGLYNRVGLISVKKGEVWGVIDEKGMLIQAPQYPYKLTPNEEYNTRYYTCGPDDEPPVLFLSLNWQPFEMAPHEKVNPISNTGHLLVSFAEGKAARHGLRSKDGEVILETIYHELSYEYEIKAYRAKLDKKWGIFHPNSGWLLPCEYDSLNSVYGMLGSATGEVSGQLLIARKGRQYGVYNTKKQTWVMPCSFSKITPYAKNVLGVAHSQPPEEVGIWVHNASTGLPLAGPYQSLSDCAGQLDFSAILAFTHNQVFSVGQTGLIKPLTDAQADGLVNRLPSESVGEYYFTHQQAALIKNTFSKSKRAEAWCDEAYELEKRGQYQRAVDLYVIAGQAGNSNGYVNAGYLFESRPELDNPALARHYYELAIQAGNAMGMNNLANQYRYGTGGEQNMKKALELFHEAEAKNNLRAASNLADIYYHDEKLKDHAQALKYYLKAYREFPNPLEIGYLYDTLLKDYASAHKYYEISAKKGQGYAYNRIGLMWEKGELGNVNLQKAQDYYQKAMKAEYSDAYAGLNLAELIIKTDPIAAKAAWQFAMDHEDVVEGLLEFGQQQGWV